MTETKYNMQLTETELKLLQNALHSVECNEKKLLNKIEKKLNTINTKKQIDEYKKEQIKVESKVEEFKMNPNSHNSKATQLAWFEYKQLLDANKTKLEKIIVNKKDPRGSKIYKTQYDWFKASYSPSLQTGKLWLKKLKKKIEEEDSDL